MPPLPLQSTVVVVSAQSSFEEDGKAGNAIWEEDAAAVELAAARTVWLALATVLADAGAAVGRLFPMLADPWAVVGGTVT